MQKRGYIFPQTEQENKIEDMQYETQPIEQKNQILQNVNDFRKVMRFRIWTRCLKARIQLARQFRICGYRNPWNWSGHNGRSFRRWRNWNLRFDSSENFAVAKKQTSTFRLPRIYGQEVTRCGSNEEDA